MDHATGTESDIRDPSLATGRAERQVLRAWLLMLGGFAVFLLLLLFGAQNVRSYVMDANQARTATLEPVNGQSLLIRSSEQDDWRLVSERTTVEEGDSISTGGSTTGWITLFDQGTVEISENSVVRVNRMRTSRLFREQKEIELESIRGTIYVGMAPRGEFSASLLEVTSGPVTARMRDEIGQDESGSMLVDAQRLDSGDEEEPPLMAVRVAALRGSAEVESGGEQRLLETNQQVIADASGQLGDTTAAHRELIQNGDFARHLANWVEYHDFPGDGDGVSGTVERVPVERGAGGHSVALRISRSTDAGDSWDTGVQQAVDQALRVHSSLHLSLSLRIDEQQPPGGGAELTEFPLIVKINYVDVQDQNRTWWHGFYVLDDPANPVPDEHATRVRRGTWIDITRDLGGLEPLPRRISSVLVYSSGHSYRALVADLSLTSSETGNSNYD